MIALFLCADGSMLMRDAVALLCVGSLFGALVLGIIIMLYGVRGWRWLAADIREWFQRR